MFFRHSTKRSAAQWQVVIRRTYPWFQYGFRLFEKEPEKEAAKIDFRKKFMSVTLPKDMPFRGGKHPNYHLGKLQSGHFLRDSDDLEVHKDARCAVNKIKNSADALYPSLELNSSSSAEFDAWWKARFQDPSMTKNIGKQSIQVGEVIVTSVIVAGDLELRFGDEEDQRETLAKQPTVEATPSARRNKRKEATPAQDSAEEIPAEVIAESIALAQKQQETPMAELSSSELALFEDAEAEQSIAVPVSEEQVAAAIPGLVAEVPRTTGILALVTCPLKPHIVAMPIYSLPGSSTTTSFSDPELVEFEAMDLDAQLDKLEKLSSTPGKAKSKAVDEAVDRVKIWQSAKLDLDDSSEAFDQLMKDLDLLHRENMAPRPILELNFGLARDVLNLYNRYEDLKPSFKASEFCKATHKANLADYAKQKAELDQMVTGYKEAKTTADKLEKQIEELQKQPAVLRERQNKLGAGQGTKTKATFLVHNMVVASRLALKIALASLHQGMLLQQEISTKKTGLQETLRKLGL
ncbi:unnamed protein product [Prunus armeniaca]